MCIRDRYTGLAHYLEHVMFKGTDKIGALNWTEEEPIYKEIIAKYDQMAEEADQSVFFFCFYSFSY